MRVAVAAAALLVAGILLLAPEQAAARGDGLKAKDQQQQRDAEAKQEEEEEEPPKIRYTVEISGELEPSLKKLLEDSSQLIELGDRPPATLAGLKRRAEADVVRFQEVLRSEGFYAGTVSETIDDESDPAKVAFTVDPGAPYLLSDYVVRYEGGTVPDPNPAQDLADLGLEIGMVARAPTVAEAQRKLVKDLNNSGFPFAEVADRKAVVDHASTTMSVTLEVDQGPEAWFGPTTITGLTDVDEPYIRRLLPWKEGELYDAQVQEEGRRTLSGTGLFSGVRISHAEELEADGRLPITVALAERPHRTIGFGLSASTSEGPGGHVFWEHRNLLGGNERLRLSATAAFIRQSVDADFRKPNFLRLDQDLLTSVVALKQDTDAFKERSLSSFLGLERKLSETWSVRGGGSAEFSRIDDEQGFRSFILFGAPLSATRDTSNSLLNPTKGTKLTLNATPYYGTLDENVTFLVGELFGTAYLSLDPKDRIVLAGRTRFGSIVGADSQTLPANKRFYSGGGGSVRGYKFQSVGPLDQRDDPLGGSSVLEISGEIRLRVTETIGIVPFVDGGIVGEEPYLDFNEDFLWAAGLGLRYFTGIGPLRLDVAFPINPRPSDDFFQFYVSLGQAF